MSTLNQDPYSTGLSMMNADQLDPNIQNLQEKEQQQEIKQQQNEVSVYFLVLII
jgi:hypothetical protein